MSGMNRRLRCGKELQIFTAFEEVTHTSDHVFASAVEFT